VLFDYQMKAAAENWVVCTQQRRSSQLAAANLLQVGAFDNLWAGCASKMQLWNNSIVDDC
jgi:hypothetical protein